MSPNVSKRLTLRGVIYIFANITRGYKVMRRSMRKSWIPKTAAKRIQKLHLKVAEGSVKSRQTHSRLKFDLQLVCLRQYREKTEVIERGTARNRATKSIVRRKKAEIKGYTKGGGLGREEPF